MAVVKPSNVTGSCIGYNDALDNLKFILRACIIKHLVRLILCKVTC